MDFYEMGKELKYIGDILQTVRNASKGTDEDYTKPPFDHDAYLMQHLIHEKIQAILDKKKQS